MNTPPIDQTWALSAPLEVVTFDIYRDIHKGIRVELFAVTGAAGSIDPQDEPARRAFAGRFRALVELLDAHASHEDRYLTPLLQPQAPQLSATITHDHGALEHQLHGLAAAIERFPAARPARRLAAHRIYLGIASFTAEYLRHQAVEELQVMPALATGYTVQELLKVNGDILADIPPPKMMATLALLLPAMNVEDRTEMLGAMRAAAPAPMFAAVRDLAQTVLPPADYAALEQRLA